MRGMRGRLHLDEKREHLRRAAGDAARAAVVLDGVALQRGHKLLLAEVRAVVEVARQLEGHELEERQVEPLLVRQV